MAIENTTGIKLEKGNTRKKFFRMSIHLKYIWHYTENYIIVMIANQNISITDHNCMFSYLKDKILGQILIYKKKLWGGLWLSFFLSGKIKKIQGDWDRRMFINSIWDLANFFIFLGKLYKMELLSYKKRTTGLKVKIPCSFT